jgi:hypothetical protein
MPSVPFRRRRVAFLFVAALAPACEQRLSTSELARIENVMTPGMTITAVTTNGPITIHAKSPLGRSYTFGPNTLAVTMIPRAERWYGSLGLYSPGASFGLWPRSGIYRAVVEEGQHHFNTSAEALQWLKERSWMPFVYRNDGLVVGWGTTSERHQLNAEVWQFFVQHQKPASLEGANDASITVAREPGAT